MWRYHGKVDVNPSAPTASGICDRCGDAWNLSRLHFQYEFRGTSLANLQLRVCPKCMDKPQEQLRAIVLPADPVPVMNPRPNAYATQMDNSSPALTWDQAYAQWDSGDSVWDPS